MIQNIYPSNLDNSFGNYKPCENDYLLHFDKEGRLLTKIADGLLSFTAFSEISDVVYLFSVDDSRYFLALDEQNYMKNGFEYRNIRELRDSSNGKELFASFTAYHLWKWYSDSNQ